MFLSVGRDIAENVKAFSKLLKGHFAMLKRRRTTSTVEEQEVWGKARVSPPNVDRYPIPLAESEKHLPWQGLTLIFNIGHRLPHSEISTSEGK